MCYSRSSEAVKVVNNELSVVAKTIVSYQLTLGKKDAGLRPQRKWAEPTDVVQIQHRWVRAQAIVRQMQGVKQT